MIEHEQISLFDIELPPANAPEPQKVKQIVKNTAEVLKEPLPTTEHKFSMARVPDTEYTRPNKIPRPKVEEILKKIQNGASYVSTYEFLSDVIECGAIAINNKIPLNFNPEREERYMQIIQKYDKAHQLKIAEIFSDIYLLLSTQIDYGFKDYLGELFMRSNTSNSKAGQFFTPYDVSLACAKMSINGDDIEKYIEEDKILTLYEPTCGAGGMIIAAVNVLYEEHHFNYARNLLVQCSDIDKRCVLMTYLQLACSGVPAIIYHQDALSLKTWDKWETPAYVMQYSRFRNVFKTA